MITSYARSIARAAIRFAASATDDAAAGRIAPAAVGALLTSSAVAPAALGFSNGRCRLGAGSSAPLSFSEGPARAGAGTAAAASMAALS
jgi:hypothetical protein